MGSLIDRACLYPCVHHGFRIWQCGKLLYTKWSGG